MKSRLVPKGYSKWEEDPLYLLILSQNLKGKEWKRELFFEEFLFPLLQNYDLLLRAMSL